MQNRLCLLVVFPSLPHVLRHKYLTFVGGLTRERGTSPCPQPAAATDTDCINADRCDSEAMTAHLAELFADACLAHTVGGRGAGRPTPKSSNESKGAPEFKAPDSRMGCPQLTAMTITAARTILTLTTIARIILARRTLPPPLFLYKSEAQQPTSPVPARPAGAAFRRGLRVWGFTLRAIAGVLLWSLEL